MTVLNPYTLLNVSKTTLLTFAWLFGLFGMVIGSSVGFAATSPNDAVIHQNGTTIRVGNVTADFNTELEHQYTVHKTIHTTIQKETPELCPTPRTEKLELLATGEPDYCTEPSSLSIQWNKGLMQFFSIILFPYIFTIANITSYIVYAGGLSETGTYLLVGVVGVTPPAYYAREKYRQYKYGR